MTLTKFGADIARGVIIGVVLSVIGFSFDTWQFWFALTTFAITNTFINSLTE